MKSRLLLCLMALILCLGCTALAEEGVIAPCEKETEIVLSLPREMAYIRDIVPLPNGTFLICYSELTDEDAPWEKQYSDFLACFDTDGNMLWHQTLREQEEAYDEYFIPHPDHVLQYVANGQELPDGYTRKIGFDGTFGESKKYKVREQEAKVTPISAYPYYIERYSSGDMYDAPECTVYNTLTGAKKHMHIKSTSTRFFSLEDGLLIMDRDDDKLRFRLFDETLKEVFSSDLPDSIDSDMYLDTCAESSDYVHLLFCRQEYEDDVQYSYYTLVDFHKESSTFTDAALQWTMPEVNTSLSDDLLLPCKDGHITAVGHRKYGHPVQLCLLTEDGKLIQLDELGTDAYVYLVGRDEHSFTLLMVYRDTEPALRRYSLTLK